MNIMIAACAKSGDLARAESWIPWMLDQGIQPNVISYKDTKTNISFSELIYLSRHPSGQSLDP